jgi:hypothetical protein
VSAPANAYPVTGTATVASGGCTFRGFWLFSTAGATVTIYDGTSAAGTVLAKVVLAAGGDRSLDIADGLRCGTGVHLVASAAVEGHVRIG